ncbi:HAD-IB family hydrolase [Streptomyces sp. NPDC048109]|uniref:HAD family hydrolase n=1 Tax=unclassified Streptomyces TaxID=2593676 RepID=UPI003402820A
MVPAAEPTPLPPSRLVFSDVDETLIDCKSMFDFLDHYLSEHYGSDGADRAGRVRAELLARAARGVPREETNRAYYRAWAGEPVTRVAESGERWFARRSADPSFFLAGTRAALLEHRAGGAALILVSGSFPAVLDPLARAIGARHVLCTRPEERGGRFTGAIVGQPMIGVDKGTAVREVLAAYPTVDPADCFAYGDHVSDLPMLAEVGHPVLVGDRRELLARLPGAGEPTPLA